MLRKHKVWSAEDWARLEHRTRAQALAAPSEQAAWNVIVCQARGVLQSFSSSFFAVTRFLPAHKRTQVEAIYAAVRYPDEVVDTFPMGAAERIARLESWGAAYERGLQARTVREAVEFEVPCFLAAFTRVVRQTGIPSDHYRSFLDAMRLDVRPRPFATLDDLISAYIYGSAIVVGYFLTHIYGPSRPGEFTRALNSARNLGIALQLTNFIRDVGEDQRRGRQYLPVDLLAAEGITQIDATDGRQQEGLRNVVKRVATEAATYYLAAQRDLGAFAVDSRVAIQACIDVYGQLNERIRTSRNGLTNRESVPLTEKLRVLPVSKYWRLPLAYLGW